MAGLVPAIHVLFPRGRPRLRIAVLGFADPWMAVTSTAMTTVETEPDQAADGHDGKLRTSAGARLVDQAP